MVKNLISLLLFYFLFTSQAYTQAEEQFRFSDRIDWSKEAVPKSISPAISYFMWSFPEAEYIGSEHRIPVFQKRIPIDLSGTIEVEIKVNETTELTESDSRTIFMLSKKPEIKSYISKSRDEYFLNFSFVPLFLDDHLKIQRIESFSIVYSITARSKELSARNPEYVMFSELAEGTIYKIPFKQRGVYKLTYSYLKNQGIDVASIIPSRLQFFGNGGGPLAESLAESRIDDLQENPIFVSGEDDGSFDPEDYILVYAEGPDIWKFDTAKNNYSFIKNIYSNENYYFLKMDGEAGLRIENITQPANASYTSKATDNYQVHEVDKTNLLAQYDHTEGTGQSWYGESFASTKQQDFSAYFDFSNLIDGEMVSVYSNLAARDGNGSSYSLTINDDVITKNISQVSVGNPELTYARNGIISTEIQPGKEISKILISTDAQQAWLDKIVIVGRSNLIFNTELLFFSDKKSLNYDDASFEISSNKADFLIWDITNPVTPFNQQFTNRGNNDYGFSYPSDRLRRFVAFDPNGDLATPGKANLISNQNIHDIADADMLIVYHKDFMDQAEKLADHRRKHNDFIVHTVDIEKIYNEFSSGKQDPTALRDFVKMVYDRSPSLSYLLLFGDGSYDYKAIMNEVKNDNFIPVYETKQSLNPISGYVSDDYYGLLSPTEGVNLKGDLDIGIGRLPVSTNDQAKRLVDKIINYETSPGNDGDWQNRIAFLADDEDASRHLDQTEVVCKKIKSKYPVLNQEKIYFDAFQQEVNPGGHRYPDVEKSINDNMFKGILALTYIGHGGPNGLAQERVLRMDDIQSWKNDPKLPLFITATCSFTGFDDPAIKTAGEASILKESGGVIALFSTVRLVYSGENSKLINAVFDEIFKKYEGKYLKLGDIIRIAKNKIGNKDNKRKFSIFGDPAMQLAIPEYNVITSKINDISVEESFFPDTLRALSKVKIEGFIAGIDGSVMEDFNGIVYPTVFDKTQMIKTLGNDPGSPKRTFELQKQILFKGAASVNAGRFIFEFIIPKDIDYSFGQGKISYFYSNGDNQDAAGYFDRFIVGGSIRDNFSDDQGPEILLYMNDTNFVSGGTTNNRPVLLAYISDESGINISGTSIGHDLTGILDEDGQNVYKLNDFFQSSLDDFTSGTVTFPLDKLESGQHSIYVEAWDILNNKGDASIEFIVANDEDQVLDHIFNYPNPFSNYTKFYFEHSLPDTELEINIYIFDLAGKIVKTIQSNTFTDGFKVNDIEWNGKNALNQGIGNGIYIYKIQVKSRILGKIIESDYNKLVIIK